MRAVVASGKGYENLAVKEVPVPEIGPDQLLARVDAAGVCTSNLKLIAQGEDHSFMNGWDMAQSPIILGDEGAVTVVQVGSNLKHLYDVGQRYAVQPAVDTQPIRHREKYRNNAEGVNKCAIGYTLGGLLAQYIRIQEEVLKADCLLPLPDNDLASFEVSMGEPISCVYSAQTRHYHLLKDGPHAERTAHIGLKPGGITVIRGAGVMGRMHAEFALRFKPEVLIVADHKEERRARTEDSIAGKAASADCRLMCISPNDLATVITDVSRGRGADDFILALGVKDEQQRALAMLAPGGVANLFGGLPRGDHILDLDTIA
ncbi:MAG: alcohol dehydrogenase catalytic domain-containing protein, partial [Planctomycetales bacterium]